MPTDVDDFFALLTSEEADLTDLPAAAEKKNGNGGAPAAAITALEGWKDEPVAGKLDKIRAVFLNAKTPTEVYAAASLMSLQEWLDMVVKLSPKNVQVTGGISFRHMLEEFGPIEKDKYRFHAIPVECTELID